MHKIVTDKFKKMIKYIILKNNEARLIIEKQIFGLGLHINFYNAITTREINWVLSFDLLFVRFWWTNYRKRPY